MPPGAPAFPFVAVQHARDLPREEAVRALAGASARIFLLVRDAPNGFTCDEVERMLPDLPHQTVSARLRDLESAGVVDKSRHLRRETRKGRTAAVYVVPDRLAACTPRTEEPPPLLPGLPEPPADERQALIARSAAIVVDGIRRGDPAAAIAARIVDLALMPRG